MMPGQNDPWYGFAHNVDDMSDPSGPTDDENYNASSTPNDEWASHLGSLPSELAASMWPPSVVQAAQNLFPTSLSPAQPYVPVNNYTMSGGEFWHPSPTAGPSYSDRSRHLGSLQVNNPNEMNDGNHFGMSSPGLGLGSKIEEPTPPVSESARGNEDRSSNTPSNKPSLRCLICSDNPRFTGQYAKRNLDRHMERHNSCDSPSSSRHIRCEQPGCTSTFGRPDALLVHLRRSHPELNTPPAKKRKREVGL